MKGVLDELGFVKPGGYILAFFPAYNCVFGYRVIARRNEGMEFIDYGPIPYTFSDIGVEGVMKANSSTGIYKFKWVDDRVTGDKKNNMFYFEGADTLMDAIIDIRPVLLQNFLFLTEEQIQGFFNEYDIKVVTTGADVFGFWRGKKRFLFLPKLEAGFRTHNPSSMNLKSRVNMLVAEYHVEFIRDKKVLKDLWFEKLPVYKATIPTYARTTIDSMLEVYGLTGSEFLREFNVDRILREA
ncbi:MAG: hypothetical protein ABC596_06945 [Candidatus Methanosuratincola petrocarbonis]